MGWLIVLTIVFLIIFAVTLFFVFRTRKRNQLAREDNPHIAQPRQDWVSPVAIPQQQVNNAYYAQNQSAFSMMPSSPPASTPVGSLPPTTLSKPVFRVTARRPGTNPASTGITIQKIFPDPILRPGEVKVFYNQKVCSVCHQSIDWSSRSTGWARCLYTNRLVHGHCYLAMKDEKKKNWCAVCEGTCQSNLPMRIELSTC